MAKVLAATASKEEEIKFIKAVADRVEVDTYIGSFLNPKMLSWLERQIKDDMNTDAYEYIEGHQKARSEVEAATVEAGSLKGKIADKNEELQRLTAHTQGLAKDLLSRDNEIERLTDLIESQARHNGENEARNNELRKELAAAQIAVRQVSEIRTLIADHFLDSAMLKPEEVRDAMVKGTQAS